MTPIGCPGQDSMFMKPQDVAEVKCRECGQAVEFWPDELMRRCPACGHRFANPENSMKCLEWCRYAAQCRAAMRGGDDWWVGPLRTELVERMKKAFGDDEGQIEHALAVLDLAEEIGREIGADPLVLVPAAICHDIGRAAASPQGPTETHAQEGNGQTDHGEVGRESARQLLADIRLPGAVEEEILQLIAHHHDRDTMNTPNGAALFDADLIVNLQRGEHADPRAALAREALTEAAKRIGAGPSTA